MSIYSAERQNTIIEKLVREFAGKKCRAPAGPKNLELWRSQGRYFVEDRGDVDLEPNLRAFFERLLPL